MRFPEWFKWYLFTLYNIHGIIDENSTLVPVMTWCRAACNEPITWPNVDQHHLRRTGGRLNKKDGLTRYGDSHVKDKTS